jgi:secernin
MISAPQKYDHLHVIVDEMYSCDTFVCMPDVTAGHVLLFGKNSDRDRNEPMCVEYYPKQEHTPGSSLQITRTCISQAENTHALFVARPAWMWGAEIAVNEHGVCGGNEALFCKRDPAISDKDTITGMDILRLCIERSKNAAQAKDIVIAMIEAFEQGGNCGFEGKFYYHNAFLIADTTEAYHLETCGRSWVWKRIVAGVYAISNAMRLTDDFDECSADIKMLKQNDASFSWAAAFSDPFVTSAACGFGRRCRTESLLNNNSSIELETAIAVTRDHGIRADKVSEGITGQDICMHAGGGPIRKSQTTCSWVVAVKGAPGASRTAVHTSMGAAPCLQIFRALSFPASGACRALSARPSPLLTYQADGARSYWWTLELLHRYALRRYDEWRPLLHTCQLAMEPSMLLQSQQFLQGTVNQMLFESASDAHWRMCDAIVGVLLQYATGALACQEELFAQLEHVSAGKIAGPCVNLAFTSPPSITYSGLNCDDPAPPSRLTTLLFQVLDLLSPKFLYASAWKAANQTAKLPM